MKAPEQYEEYETHQKKKSEGRPCIVEKEMGIHRRKRRSVHGRDFHGKIPYSVFNGISPINIYASCLEISDENVVDTIMEGCLDVEEMIKKLKEQTISLTKKRCIKAKIMPVGQCKIVKLSFFKKVRYAMDISFAKLKLGFRNFLYTFELWYSSLKVIEGKFGSSVAIYFKFLRKLFILNFIIFLLDFFYIILPQSLLVQLTNYKLGFTNESLSFIDSNDTYVNKNLPFDNLSDSGGIFGLFFIRNYTYEKQNLRLGDIFTGMGYLTDSVLFYGHYSNISFSLNSDYAYDIPTAYFFSTACCYFLVLCVLFLSVAESYKKCYIETSNGVQNVFAEKVLCGWDFGIAKSDAEELKYCSIYMELKELLNESSKKKKSRNVLEAFYTITIRVSLNSILLLLLVALGWCTSIHLDMHMDNADVPTIMMLMLTLTLATTLAPIFFSWIAAIEYYDCPRTALYVTLIRIFILHILIIIMIIAHRLNSSSKIVCWETVVGQDIYRLVVLDFFVGIGDNMAEFIRSRLSSTWKKIERPEFNIALNTMNLIYNQTLLYVGLYFSPGLSLIVAVKMLLTFYIRKWGAMFNCQPSKKPWRAAQMQTVFLSFAFLAFFGVIVAYGYILTSVKTSNCGPFGGRKFVHQAILHEILNDFVNSTALRLLSHFFRPGVLVIVLLLMILSIYYLRTVNSVRGHIVKNLGLIIKEQVANKKKLLTKIHKAQEDVKVAMKKSSEDRKKRHSGSRDWFSLNKDMNPSDLEDAMVSLSCTNMCLLQCNERDKSTVGFVPSNANPSEKMSAGSLQNLSFDGLEQDIGINFTCINHQHNPSLKSKESQKGRQKEFCKNFWDSDKDTHSDKEISELMSEVRKEERKCMNKGVYYNCDDNIPGRIYFTRCKK